ncbi:MAG: uroporphyrinogen-III synthase [Deltaproteobacteria bacterium]|nr:uroporphyrinogen-III synthase [Deltaproteobacteria bacterium]
MSGAPPRVLVGREEAEPLCALLAAAGLTPVHLPMLRLGPTGAPRPAGRVDLLLVSSPAAARFCPSIAEMGVPAVAVGEATAEGLRARGLNLAAVGAGGGAEAVELLAAQLEARGPEARGLYVGAATPSPELDAALAARGGGRVARWAVYDQLPVPGLALALAQVGAVEAVCFTSGSMARAWAAAGGPTWAPGTRRIVMGASTAAALEALGLPAEVVADRPRLDALVAACCRALSTGGEGRLDH